MKLSTKGRYGLRAMTDLAQHPAGQPVSLLSIAQRQNVSGNYLESMFSSLKRAGLIRSVRGAGGGYMLSRPPAQILIKDVLTVLEGDLSIVDEDASQSTQLRRCIQRHVWDEVSGCIRDIVENVTLKDLIDNSSC